MHQQEAWATILGQMRHGDRIIVQSGSDYSQVILLTTGTFEIYDKPNSIREGLVEDAANSLMAVLE